MATRRSDVGVVFLVAGVGVVVVLLMPAIQYWVASAAFEAMLGRSEV